MKSLILFLTGVTVTAAFHVPAGVTPRGALGCAVPATLPARAAARTSQPAMGLFGLGWPEIAVIGVIGVVLLGPDKLAPLAKDFGKSASGLKEVAESFSEGMKEGDAVVAEVTESKPEEKEKESV